MNMNVWRVVTAAMLVAASGCSGKKDAADPPSVPSRSPPVAAAGVVVADAKVENLEALVDHVVAQTNRLPRADFDPAALAAKLGKDPQAQFEWVRDHTSWVPYRGLLRGSKGVLLDRVGSNLDRAVLLGDLLRLSGYTVRLAHAELPRGRARELLDKVRPVPPQPVRSATQERVPDGRGRIDETAHSLVNSQASELYAMVKDEVGETGAADEQAAIDAMCDHWWVERNEEGEWIVMDVLLPGAQAGRSLASASMTSAWDAKEPMPGIPEADWHTVQLRLVIERYAGGATTESTVLESALRPAEVMEQPIMLMHMPKPWPKTLPDPATDPNAVGNAAVSVKEWVPVLQIGNRLVAQYAFTDNGDFISDPFSAGRDIGGAGGAGFMSGFGEALGGDTTASSALTAEWLDYEINVPGEAAERIRRPVFDLLGPARRSAKVADFDASTNERLVERYEALLGSAEIFVQVSELTGAFLTHLETKSVMANEAAIREFSRERDAAKASKLAAEILDRTDTWGPLPVLALWRGELGGQPSATFIDRPNVLYYRIGTPVVNADRIAYREQIDIASNSTGVHWGSGHKSFERRLRQGVADTVAEVLALGGDFSSIENTAAVFERAGKDTNPGKLVAPSDADTVHALDWPEDASARLSADVSAGLLAVVLRRPVVVDGRQRVAWWRIDPASGETIGVMDTGFHGAMDERIEMELEIVQLRNSLRNWLSDNASRLQAARARASTNVPWDTSIPGDTELLFTAHRVRQVLYEVAKAGF